MGPYALPKQVFRAVPWVGKGVGYEIFPNSFYNGNPFNDLLWQTDRTDEYYHNPLWQKDPRRPKPFEAPWINPPVTTLLCCHEYFGGDLRGILDQLPYLKALGVNLVYLTPIFEAGSTHGYDTTNYLKIAPWLGRTQTLKELLTRGRALGIHFIFDFVPEDTGLGSPFFQSVVREGPKSPYWNWYTVYRWPFTPGDARAYQAWQGIGSLPLLRTTNPAVLHYLLKVAQHWIRFGFSGLRVDSPQTLANEATFIQDLRQAIHQVNPEAYLVGEDWGLDPQWVGPQAFDSLMNYALGRNILLPYAAEEPFWDGSWTLEHLVRFYALYPIASVAMGFNVIDTHDTSRLLSAVGGGNLGQTPSPTALARERLAAALLYALPGAPIVFQGDECAFLGEKFPDDAERYPLQWPQCRQSMLLFYQRLGALKTHLAVLHSPLWRPYLGKGSLLGFFRGTPGKGEFLALFNDDPHPASVTLPPGRWKDLWNGRTLEDQLTLPGISFRYLLLE